MVTGKRFRVDPSTVLTVLNTSFSAVCDWQSSLTTSQEKDHGKEVKPLGSPPSPADSL